MSGRNKGRRGFVALLGAVLIGGAGAAGLAWATIPDSAGIIHGCYAKFSGQSGGELRVIDTDRGQTCRSSEVALDWSARSAPAAHGVRGFTASAPFTVPAGVTSLAVEAWGTGGGGGGGAGVFCGGGGGAGAGGFVKGVVAVTPGEALDAVVGTGGAGGNGGPAGGDGTPGGAGGDTGLGPHGSPPAIVAQGGGGGGAGTTSAPGSPGAGGQGNPNGGLVIAGGAGVRGQCTDSGFGGLASLGTRPLSDSGGGAGGPQVFSTSPGHPGVKGEPGYMIVEW